MSWKTSQKILGLSVNTLTTDDNYSLLNRDNLTEPIQIQLSKKKTPFSQLVFAVLKCKSSFEPFENKMTLIAYVFSKISSAKNVFRKMSRKSRFRRPLNKQHGKRTNTVKICRTAPLVNSYYNQNRVGKSSS